jgi:hypothetical protein
MSKEMDASIARAIANIAIFLEFSADEILKADAAVGAMEQLAADLQSLDEGAQKQLSAAIWSIAPEYGERDKWLAGKPRGCGGVVTQRVARRLWGAAGAVRPRCL